MIIIKTKLSKIPNSCGKCPFSIPEGFSCYDSNIFCAITKKDCPFDKTVEGEKKYKKADWCPIVEIKENE